MIFLPYRPNWAEGSFSATYRMETAVQRLYRGGERRQNLAAFLLRTYAWNLYAGGPAAEILRELIAAAVDEPVATCDWVNPVRLTADVSSAVLAVETIGHRDFRVAKVCIYRTATDYELCDVVSYGESAITLSEAPAGEWNAGVNVYPVRIGYCEQLPELPSITDQAATGEIEWIEAVESISPDIYTLPDLALQTYLGRPVWPFRPYWGRPAEAWQSPVAVSRQGFGKNTLYQVRDETGRRLNFALQDAGVDESRLMVRFFEHVLGRFEGFWCPSYRNNLEIVAVDGVTLSVKSCNADRSFGRPGYQHVAIGGLTQVDLREVVEISEPVDGLHQVTLDAPLSAGHDLGSIRCSWLLYVRHAADDLQVNWVTDRAATATVGLIELTKEYTEQESGQRPIWLYEFVDTDGVSRRWTSFGRSQTVGGESWLPQDINHGGLKSGYEFLDDGCELKVGAPEPDHYLRQFVSIGWPGALTCRIYMIQYGDADLPDALYEGEVLHVLPKADGIVVLKLGSIMGINEHQIPNVHFQGRCNHSLGSVGCGVVLAEYTTLGNVSDVSRRFIEAPEWATKATAEGETYGPSWFVFGRVSWNGQVRMCIRQVGGKLFLNRPFIGIGIGASVAAVAGCDKRKATCVGKFDNGLNHLGFSLAPKVNPQLRAMVQDPQTISTK